MRNLKLRVILVLVFLGTTATVSPLWLYPTLMERGSSRAAKLPLVLAGWTGQELPVDDATKEILETDDLIQRNYTRGDDPASAVQLAVVFSPDNRRVAHPPEVCYKGAGWEVAEKTIVKLDGLPPMVRLILGKGPQRDFVMYCYKSGPELTASYYEQQLNIIANTLRRRAMSSALLRFSTQLGADESIDAAETRVTALARPMMPEIQKALGE